MSPGLNNMNWRPPSLRSRGYTGEARKIKSEELRGMSLHPKHLESQAILNAVENYGKGWKALFPQWH
jgi:hypothetical protein